MIKAKTAPSKKVIDLDGPEGNVYQIFSLAKTYCDQLGWDYDKFDAEVKFFADSYEDVIGLFDSWFGDFCDLETSQEYLLEAFAK